MRGATSDLLESEFTSSRADHEWRSKCLLEIVLPLRKTTMTSGSMSVVSFSVEQYFPLLSTFTFFKFNVCFLEVKKFSNSIFCRNVLYDILTLFF